jgi:hypothetical protein
MDQAFVRFERELGLWRRRGKQVSAVDLALRTQWSSLYGEGLQAITKIALRTTQTRRYVCPLFQGMATVYVSQYNGLPRHTKQSIVTELQSLDARTIDHKKDEVFDVLSFESHTLTIANTEPIAFMDNKLQTHEEKSQYFVGFQAVAGIVLGSLVSVEAQLETALLDRQYADMSFVHARAHTAMMTE